MDPTTPIKPEKGATQPPPATQPTSKSSGLISPTGIYQVRVPQNLLDSTNVVSVGSREGMWRSIILDVLAVFFAGVFGYSFARYLAGGFSPWLMAGALLLWAAVSVLEGFLQKKIARRVGVIFLESVALVICFYTYAWQALALTIAVALIFLVWGYFSMRRELNNAIEIRFFTASGKLMGKLVTAAILFMVIMYAALTNSNGNFFISQGSFNVFYKWGASLAGNFYPTVPLNGSFNDFAQAVAQMQLQDNPQFQSLTPAEQTQVVAQSANEVMSTFISSSSVEAAPGTSTPATIPAAITSQPASNVFYNYFASISAQLQSRFNNTFVGAWGLVLFLILRGIGIIVVWAGQFVALLFYELLLATGFMKISEEPQTKEDIGY